jgi:ADP-ribosylglycohydrolase
MAMAILHGLVPNSETIRGSPQDVKLSSELPLDISGIQMFFNRWINSPPFDIGSTTSQALRIISSREAAALKKENFRPIDSFKHTLSVTSKSQSNGCLMRITPLAVWGYQLNKEDLYNAVLL